MHLFYVALLTVLDIDYNLYLIPMLYDCLIAYIMYMFDCFICMYVGKKLYIQLMTINMTYSNLFFWVMGMVFYSHFLSILQNKVMVISSVLYILTGPAIFPLHSDLIT
jgi:hypothetical protein